MRVLLLSLFILLFINSFAQSRIANPWAEQMQTVSDSLEKEQYLILSDTLRQRQIESGLLDSTFLDSNRIWKLSHIMYSGWEQIVGIEASNYLSIEIAKYEDIFIRENVILKSFQPFIITKFGFKGNDLPFIFGRNDPLNCKYTAFLSENIMIIRYIHSYPDGNMTSFYHEEYYFFTR